MNSCGEDIKDMLEAESSLGLVFGADLFVGKEPPIPNTIVTIFDTYGSPPQLLLNPSDGNYEYPSVQIRVRNTDYRNGWDLIQKIQETLHGRAQETWNGTLYSVIYCSSGPAMLDWDKNNRVRFIINFNAQRR